MPVLSLEDLDILNFWLRPSKDVVLLLSANIKKGVTLKDELDGIVLNGGTINTKSSVNMEFSKQDLL